MAALIPEARAARMEANRLRRETRALKLSMRYSASYASTQLRTSEAALGRIQERRQEPLPSPWSSLQWTYDDEALAAVLVAIS